MKLVEIIVCEEVNTLFRLDKERLEKHAEKVLESSGVGESEINIVFVNDDKITELNEKFRERSGPTDVLSFVLSEDESLLIEGEIYISLESAERNSHEYGSSFEEETVRLVTHGLLHLTGYVHDNDKEYKKMTDRTEKFVKDFFLMEK